MLLAYCAKRYAGRFPCLLTCTTFVSLKLFIRSRMPSIILHIVAGASLVPFNASATIKESHSNITSRPPTSHAKITPSSIAFALLSNEPSGQGIFNLVAAVTLPALSLMTIPTPEQWAVENVTPSTLSFYHGGVGGTHVMSSLEEECDNLRLAVWNSANRNLAFWTNAELWSRARPWRLSLRLNNKHQATIRISSSNSSPKC